MSSVSVRGSKASGLDHLADTPHPGPAADEAERRRRRRAAAAASRSVEARPAEDGGGVGRPAAEAGARGDALAQLDRGADRPARPAPGARGCRAGVDRWRARRWRRPRLAGASAAASPAVASTTSQLVGQVEADHLGVDQVEAVGPDAGDPQGQRELGRERRGGRPRRLSLVRRRPATRRSSSPVARREAGPRRRGRAPRAGPRARRRPRRTPRRRRATGERAAQHLAALRERLAGQREQRASASPADGRLGSAHDAHQRGLDLGPGDEHRRPAPCRRPRPSAQ